MCVNHEDNHLYLGNTSNSVIFRGQASLKNQKIWDESALLTKKLSAKLQQNKWPFFRILIKKQQWDTTA